MNAAARTITNCPLPLCAPVAQILFSLGERVAIVAHTAPRGDKKDNANVRERLSKAQVEADE